ncbi:MAG: ribonuclease III domain-containing protein [Eubacteriales bacterium]
MPHPLFWLGSADTHDPPSERVGLPSGQAGLPTGQAGLPSVTALAFLGDAVHGLYVRGLLLQRGMVRSGQLHEGALGYVRADAQARAWQRLQPFLTESEQDLGRRAFNSHHLNKPRHVPGAEYRAATAFEALLGMLYWTGDMDRLTYLLELAVQDEAGGQCEPEGI